MCLTDTDRRIKNLIYVSTRDIRVGGKESLQTISCFFLQQFHIASALILVDHTSQINWSGLSNQQCESSRENMCHACAVFSAKNLRKWFTIGLMAYLVLVW
jgi:hypothetical protein